MRTAVSSLDLVAPRSLRDALALLRDEPGLVPLAGCTDLYVAMNFGKLPARRFLDLASLEPLRRISARGETLVLGALATYAAILRSPLVAKRLPMLAAAARTIGGPQIQSRGTIGGNVGNASPAGDTLPVLAASDAIVVLASARDGERRVPLTEYYTGYRASVRRGDELIVAIEVPRVAGKQWFRKVGTRAAQAISKIVVAGARGRDGAARLALGSVGPTVVRARRTEAALAAGASADEARAVLESEIAPIDDDRSTASYRRRVAGNLLARFWSDTKGR